MNVVLERVNQVCIGVRETNKKGVTFKKLIGSIRSKFKETDFDLIIKTKKDKYLDASEFYVNAYYDAEDDFNNEPPVEIVVHHNFKDIDIFSESQITDFLIQIYDATVHEYRHQQQSRHRNYQTFSNHNQSPYKDYLADSDEMDAYAMSIAIELLRAMSRDRAKRYMTRVTVLAKMRQNLNYVSPNLKTYIDHFGLNFLTKKLTKKIYKHLDSLDKTHIFK